MKPSEVAKNLAIVVEALSRVPGSTIENLSLQATSLLSKALEETEKELHPLLTYGPSQARATKPGDDEIPF